MQACPSHCDLGCVCFVLLIVSPHCEQEIINTTQNGMDMPVAVCIVIQIHRWNIIVIYSIFYLLLAGCICLQGCRDLDITEIDITESDVTETDITESDITESDITESDIT